jgi:hypothetical protein
MPSGNPVWKYLKSDSLWQNTLDKAQDMNMSILQMDC